MSVPDGFEVTIAAAPPLVGYPMMACLDDLGRLYIAESDGRNLTSKAEIEKELPRFVRRLVDVDGDGVYDKSTIFADKMTMPEGGLWHNGALYIISPPYLWRLEDTNDDGVADKREKVIGYMEFDGRANQHGPYLGPNGRFYFSGGHFGYQFKGTDGSETGSSRAAGPRRRTRTLSERWPTVARALERAAAAGRPARRKRARWQCPTSTSVRSRPRS